MYDTPDFSTAFSDPTMSGAVDLGALFDSKEFEEKPDEPLLPLGDNELQATVMAVVSALAMTMGDKFMELLVYLQNSFEAELNGTALADDTEVAPTDSE